MKQKLLHLWRLTRSSYWFLPSLMVVSAIALAFTNLHFDLSASNVDDAVPRWFAVADHEAARTLLSTIAGSMMTVAGVTFSIVIVAFTLASSQFGPRMLTGFMQDTGNQLVLGTFISVFAYCLVVLLHLPGEAGNRLLPQTSVMTAMILVAIAVGVLIFFFHHIADSIHAGTLVHESGAALVRSIELDVPAKHSRDSSAGDADDRWPPSGFSEFNATVSAPRSGYLTRIDFEQLAEVAEDCSLRILVAREGGDFVLEGEALALVSPRDGLNDEVERALRTAFAQVDKRESAGDLSLAIDRVTEIAVRALSPGINDPYTAVSAVHQLTVAIDRLLGRLPAPIERERNVFIRSPDPARALEVAFGPIRDYGREDVSVLTALTRGLQTLIETHGDRHGANLEIQLERVVRLAPESLVTSEHAESIARLARGDRA